MFSVPWTLTWTLDIFRSRVAQVRATLWMEFSDAPSNEKITQQAEKKAVIITLAVTRKTERNIDNVLEVDNNKLAKHHIFKGYMP
jgi:hypothetical protein